MFKNLKQNKGFASFVEVVVTSVIFIIASYGIFTTITMLRPEATESSRKLESAYAAKATYDRIRGYVDWRTWYNASGPLSPNSHSMVIGNYTVNYVIANVVGSAARSIDIDVYYTPI